MTHRHFLWMLLAILLLNACVGAKRYNAEVSARQGCEARETVLVRELDTRRSEAGALVQQVGELNRTVGNQEVRIQQLDAELAKRAQLMGESTTKLLTEKTALEQDLAKHKKEAEILQFNLDRVRKVQQERARRLDELRKELTQSYAALTRPDGFSIDQTGENLVLTLPDNGLFDKTGVAISASGKQLLTPVAALLSQRPALDVEIVAYTDNALPKDNKTLRDTWEWSSVRALAVVRMLTRDFNINANQLTAVGRGEFYPLVSNETPEGRLKNRRTIVIFRPDMPDFPMD